MRRFRSCLTVLILAAACLLGVWYYFPNSPLQMPTTLVPWLKRQILKNLSLQVEFSDLQLNPQTGLLTVSDVTLAVPDKKPFVTARGARLQIGEGGRVWGVLRGEIPIREIQADDVTIDFMTTLPAFPRDSQASGSLHPRFKQLLIRGLNVITPVGALEAPLLSIKNQPNNRLEFDLAFQTNPVGGEGISQGLLDFGTGTSTLRLKWDGLDLKRLHVALFLSLIFGIPDIQGATDLDLTWIGFLPETPADAQKNALTIFEREISGKVVVRDLATTFANQVITLNGNLEKTVESAFWANLNGAWATATFDISGKGKLETGKIGEFAGGASLNRFSPTPEILARLNIATIPFSFESLSGSGTFRVDHGALTSVGTASLQQLTWKTLVSSETSVAWNHSPQETHGLFSFSPGSGIVQGDYVLAHASGSERLVEVHAGAMDINLGKVGQTLGVVFEGIGQGVGSISTPLANLAGSQYAFSGSVDRFRYGQIKGNQLSFDLTGHGSDWLVKNPEIILENNGVIRLDGKIASSGYRGHLSVEKASLAFFGIDSKNISSIISFSGDLGGKLAKPTLNGNAWTEALSIGSQTFPQAKANLSIENDHLLLDPLICGCPGGGQIDGNIGIDLKKGVIEGTRMALTDANIAHMKGLGFTNFQPFFPDGKISGSLNHQNIGSASTWGFSLEGSRLKIASETVQDLSIEGSAIGNQIELRKLAGKAFGGTFELQGHSIGTGGFRGTVSVRDVAPGQMQWIKQRFTQFSGLVSMDGEMEWTNAKKTGYLTIFGKNLMTGGQELGNLGGEIKLKDDRLEISDTTFDKMGVKLGGSLSLSGKHPYQFRLLLDDSDLSFLPAALGWSSFQKGDLMVKGACNLHGDLDSTYPDQAEFTLSQLEIRRGKDLIVANKPVEVNFQNGKFELRSFELKFRQGIFGIEGIWKPGADLAITLSGDNFSLAALGNLAEFPNWAVDGNLSINGGVSGVYPNVRLNADMKVLKLAWRGRVVPELSAHCQFDPTGLTVKPLTLVLPNIKMVVNGVLPLNEAGQMGEMDLQVEIASGPIKDLPTYLPEVFNAAKGYLRASLRLYGHPFHPAISGEAFMKADELGFKGMRTPLKSLEMGVKTREGILRIEPLNALLGRGRLSGFGEADFSQGLGSMSASLSGKNLDLSWGGIELKKAEANLIASGSFYRPVVRGAIKIPKGRMRISDNLLSKTLFALKLPLESLDYDLKIDIPRNFWMKNSMINAEMRGKFNLSGDLKEVHLKGGFQVVQGWLFFQRRKFNIDSGEVRFGESDGKFDPHVFLKSSINMQTTQIYLTLDGRLSSFTPQLYSSPPMAEGDLFSLLTLGRNRDEAFNSNSKDLLEKEILEGLKNTYLSGLLSSTLSTALSLDELFLGSLFDRTTGVSRSFLRVGKYVGHNIFLAYEGTLSNEDKKSYIVEYRLPKGFILNLEMEKPTNRTRVGVKYDWKF